MLEYALMGRFSGSREFFKNLPALEESARHMETAFPLAALAFEEHFAATVEITEPFGVFSVLEVRPSVVVHAVEPFEATLVAGELVALNQ